MSADDLGEDYSLFEEMEPEEYDEDEIDFWGYYDPTEMVED